MDFNSKFLFSLAIAVPSMVNAVVWNVGDAASCLRFVYDPNITNVLEVTYCDFKSCNPTSPLATYNTGDDKVPITKLHQYFISSNSVDCRNGLKVDILAYDSPYLRYWRYDDGPNCAHHQFVNDPFQSRAISFINLN
ncbi:hypothetical protein MKX03_021123 [Papaver bracteatum]|nr:hypothetical protein MKX03_021123 [Papaver bracteatum]